MTYFAAVIGKMNIDFIFRGVDVFPKPGEEVFSSDFQICLGGGPMVIPFHLERLGVKTRFGTFMGDDFESKVARDLLERINYKNVEIIPSTSKRPIVATSVLSSADERSFICYNSNTNESEIDGDQLYEFYKGSKVAYFPKNMAVAKRLVDDGCKLILDASWDPTISLDSLVEKLKLVSLFTPNDKEVKSICGEDSLLKCLDMLGEHLETPIIKLGRNGVLMKQGNKYIRVPGLKKFNTVDPTGAGDNFLAGFIFGIFLESDLLESVKLGNIMGGLVTEVIGCYRADTNPDLVMGHLDSYPEFDVVLDEKHMNDLLA
jgi:sugar/nucleoside kinase (ribokinase family)